jgi:hypothetical protein
LTTDDADGTDGFTHETRETHEPLYWPQKNAKTRKKVNDRRIERRKTLAGRMATGRFSGR